MFEKKADFNRLCAKIADHAFPKTAMTNRIDVIELAHWVSGFLNDVYLRDIAIGRNFNKMWDFHQHIMEVYKECHFHDKSLSDVMLLAAFDGTSKEPLVYCAHLKPLTEVQYNSIKKELLCSRIEQITDEIHKLYWDA